MLIGLLKNGETKNVILQVHLEPITNQCMYENDR